MKDNYRLIPIWLLPLILLICFGLAQCGCRTGGKWVSSGSTGAKQIITPSQLVQQPNGTYTLKSKPVEDPPITLTPITPTEPIIENTYVPPKSVVKPKKITETKIKLKPLELGVPSSKLPKANTKLPPIKLEERVNVKPIKTTPTGPVKDNGGPVNPIEKNAGTKENPSAKGKAVSVEWMELFAFYFLAIMLAVFVWVLYDLHREYKKIKRTRKKPTKKKAPARRKRGKPKKKAS